MSSEITPSSQPSSSPELTPRFIGASSLYLLRYRISTLQELRDQLSRMAGQEDHQGTPVAHRIHLSGAFLQLAIQELEARLARMESRAGGAAVDLAWELEREA